MVICMLGVDLIRLMRDRHVFIGFFISLSVYVHLGNISATTKYDPLSSFFMSYLITSEGRRLSNGCCCFQQMPAESGGALICYVGLRSPKVAPGMRKDKPALLQSDLTNLE